MKKNILAIILIFNLSSLFTACFPDCPAEKYMDYRAIKSSVINSRVLANKSLDFGIRFEDIIYVVEKKLNFHLANSVYATSICEKGYEGEKYPIIRISIKSNADFSSNLPAGSELAGIVKTSGYNSNKELIESATIDNLNPATANVYYMHIEQKPETFKKHKFTIEIEKANHEILRTTTEEVTFD